MEFEDWLMNLSLGLVMLGAGGAVMIAMVKSLVRELANTEARTPRKAEESKDTKEEVKENREVEEIRPDGIKVLLDKVYCPIHDRLAKTHIIVRPNGDVVYIGVDCNPPHRIYPPPSPEELAEVWDLRPKKTKKRKRKEPEPQEPKAEEEEDLFEVNMK